jgi:hypothetical protein
MQLGPYGGKTVKASAEVAVPRGFRSMIGPLEAFLGTFAVI